MKFKRILAGILATAITLTSVTLPSFAVSSSEQELPETAAVTADREEKQVELVGETWGDYEYKVLDDGRVEISKYNGSATKLEIPSEISGKKVTSIRYWAFYGCTSLTSVTIPDSVTYIDWSAFENCTSLTTVTIGSSVTSIGDSAFYNCTSLTSINIPDSVTSIGDSAFINTAILNNQIGDLKYIGKWLIEANKEITTAKIKAGTVGIADFAFGKCSLLTSVTIPSGVTSIGYRAFENCASLKSIAIPNGIQTIAGYTFFGCTSLTSVTIPNSVTSIGGSSFSGCSSLVSITLPNSVTSIHGEAFYKCTSLKSITIPNSITSIGFGTFSGCTSLKSITIPNSVTSIGDGAFYKCTSLESVAIPNNVKSIGDGVFVSCISLESVTIPNSVKSIGDSAFSSCMSLKSISIPNSVKSIGANAFSSCVSLTSVVIPNSVTSIGNYVFKGCSALASITLPNNVTTIGDYAFFQCSSLTSITIPDSVTRIGVLAFSDCNSLMSIAIPNSVTSIGKSAFENCTSLISVTIPKSVTSIGNYAFGYYYDKDWNYLKATNFKIFCYKNTAGEKYAIDNGFEYKLLLSGVSGFKCGGKTDTVIRLNWAKNTDATGYIIEQYKGNKWVRIAKITSNATTSYKVTGLSASTRYAFRIQAYKNVTGGALRSDFTNKLVVYTNPKAMSGFKASSKSDSVINLTWAKNTSATGYILEQYKGNKWVRIAKITDNATTSYKVTGLSASTRYAFRIQAYKEFGSGAVKSAYTNKLVVYTNPKAVTGFKASAKTKNTITLSWTKNTTATGYILEQYKGNKWVRIAKITSNATTSYKVTGLTANTRYAFRVQAYKECGSGAVKSAYTNKLVVYTAK